MLINISNKFAILSLFFLGTVSVFASDQPTPSDAPPDFAPPAGPPPPPPLPIDDYIILMLFVAMVFGLIYFVNKNKLQRS